ncbi:hypothetical protein LXL04_015416 [Taraxacum kok-saghyz]
MKTANRRFLRADNDREHKIRPLFFFLVIGLQGDFFLPSSDDFIGKTIDTLYRILQCFLRSYIKMPHDFPHEFQQRLGRQVPELRRVKLDARRLPLDDFKSGFWGRRHVQTLVVLSGGWSCRSARDRRWMTFEFHSRISNLAFRSASDVLRNGSGTFSCIRIWRQPPVIPPPLSSSGLKLKVMAGWNDASQICIVAPPPM